MKAGAIKNLVKLQEKISIQSQDAFNEEKEQLVLENMDLR
jgi:hypothetical protein